MFLNKKNHLFLLILTLFTSVLFNYNIKSFAKNIQNNNFISKTQISNKSIDKLKENFNNPINIVFSDVDGTIWDFKQKDIAFNPQRSLIFAVKKLQNANIPIVLVTGRSSGEALNISKGIGNMNAYIISGQGAEILNPKGEIIYHDVIKHDTLVRFLNEVNSIKKTYNLNLKELVYIDGKPYSTCNYKFPYKWEKITYISSYDILGLNYTADKVLIYDENPENMKILDKKIKNKFPQFEINTGLYCVVTNPSVSKGNAVMILADKLGINLKNAAVIGDADNDISMLKAVKEKGGVAIAVGNATPALKETANYITSSVYDNGFAKAVDKLLENNFRLSKKADYTRILLPVK